MGFEDVTNYVKGSRDDDYMTRLVKGLYETIEIETGADMITAKKAAGIWSDAIPGAEKVRVKDFCVLMKKLKKPQQAAIITATASKIFEALKAKNTDYAGYLEGNADLIIPEVTEGRLDGFRDDLTSVAESEIVKVPCFKVGMNAVEARECAKILVDMVLKIGQFHDADYGVNTIMEVTLGLGPFRNRTRS